MLITFRSAAKPQHADAARRRRRRSAGFTLIELLVVLFIIGLLAAIGSPPVFRYLGKAKTDAARAQIHNIAASVDLFRFDAGRYPSQEEGLEALMTKPSGIEQWNGPYLKKRASLTDPWGQLYQYRFPGEHGDYDVFSLGSDKAVGGSGEAQDVGNW